MLSVGQVLSGAALVALQRSAGRHIAFSLTQACPLRCAHCIVKTVSLGSRDRADMPVETAEEYAEEFPDLKELGVEQVSFTGGEPLLALAQLQILSAAAKKAGIESTVVTACHWAKDPESANRMVESLPHIGSWHLSADRYHQEFLPLQWVANAAEAVLKRRKRVVIRIAVPTPVKREDKEFYERAQCLLPKEVEYAIQPVSKVGRAENLDLEIPAGRGRNVPCMSTGFVARSDGSVSPCCSSLIDQREGHPFEFESVQTAGLGTTYLAWHDDPLLQIIRSVGFKPVLDWLREDLPEHPLLRNIPDHPCDICVGLWRHPGTAAAMRLRCEPPAVRHKAGKLYNTVLGGPSFRGGERPRRDEYPPGESAPCAMGGKPEPAKGEKWSPQD